jgi:hypothetical protein
MFFKHSIIISIKGITDLVFLKKKFVVFYGSS